MNGMKQTARGKKQRVPRRCMNIGSVELTGVFKKLLRERLRTVKIHNSDSLMSESILVVRGGMSTVVVFWSIHNIIYLGCTHPLIRPRIDGGHRTTETLDSHPDPFSYLC
jgi:hypothetical protein